MWMLAVVATKIGEKPIRLKAQVFSALFISWELVDPKVYFNWKHRKGIRLIFLNHKNAYGDVRKFLTLLDMLSNFIELSKCISLGSCVIQRTRLKHKWGGYVIFSRVLEPVKKELQVFLCSYPEPAQGAWLSKPRRERIIIQREFGKLALYLWYKGSQRLCTYVCEGWVQLLGRSDCLTKT